MYMQFKVQDHPLLALVPNQAKRQPSMSTLSVFNEMLYAYRSGVPLEEQHTNWQYSPDQYWGTNFYGGYTKKKDENVSPKIATQKPLALALELVLRFTNPGMSLHVHACSYVHVTN